MLVLSLFTNCLKKKKSESKAPFHFVLSLAFSIRVGDISQCRIPFKSCDLLKFILID